MSKLFLIPKQPKGREKLKTIYHIQEEYWIDRSIIVYIREAWIRKWSFLTIHKKAFIKLGSWMKNMRTIDPKWPVLLLSIKIILKVLNPLTIISLLICKDSQLSVDSQKIIVPMVDSQNSSMSHSWIHIKCMHWMFRIRIKSNTKILKWKAIGLKMLKELTQLQKAIKFCYSDIFSRFFLMISNIFCSLYKLFI